MNNIPALPPPLPRARHRRIGWYAAGAVLALESLAALLLAGALYYRWRTRDRLETKLAALRAEGLPVNHADLNRWPSELPEGENAARQYTNALAHLRFAGRPVKPQFALPARGEVLRLELRDFIRAACATNQTALALATEAAQAGPARYPVDFNAPSTVQQPHHRPLSLLSELLRLTALLQAQEGDPVAAGQALEAAFATATSLDLEPCPLAQGLALRLLNRACEETERVLDWVELDDATLARLGDRLAAADTTNRMAVSIIGGRAQALGWLQLAQEDFPEFIRRANAANPAQSTEKLPPAFAASVARWARLTDGTQRFVLRAAEAQLVLAGTPLPAALDLPSPLAELERSLECRLSFGGKNFLHWLDYNAEVRATHHARLRVTRAALAIERWRTSHAGEPPESLTALVPHHLTEVPLDPYTGQPLRYRRLSDGYVVYSVGPDREDDGGRPVPTTQGKVPSADSKGGDLSFAVAR